MNKINVLMLVVLSAGMLTALTASTMSQGQTVFADDEKKCEDNGGNDCNEQNHKQSSKNDCKIEDENKDHSSSGNTITQLCQNTNLNVEDSVFCPTKNENDGNQAGVNTDSNCPPNPS